MKDAGIKTTLESSMAKLYPAKWPSDAPTRRADSRRLRIYQRLSREKFYRDVKLCTIGEGTSEIQRLVIARQLLKD